MRIIITVGYYKSREVRLTANELISYIEMLEQAFPGNWAIAPAPIDDREPDGED